MAERLQAAVIGVSTRPTCGVRDHAAVLTAELERRGVSCAVHWYTADHSSLATARSGMAAWTRELAPALEAERVEVILLHFSVFSFSYRGLPLFVHPTMATLRRTDLPLLTFMHEIVYPWGQAGLRGAVWATTQRAALIELVRGSSALAVTADFRAEWLGSRRWLPSRPVELAPVFSSLPSSSARPPAQRELPVVGLFGYSVDDATVALVLDAVRGLGDRGTGLRLELLGGPDPGSPAGRLWAREAQRRGLDGSVSFSGVLPAQELSDALAAADVLLFVNRSGAVSRKSTLASCLASGRPLLALEGRRIWRALVDADAVAVVPRSVEGLQRGLAELLGDREERERLGVRGRAFAEERMSLARSAEVVEGRLRGLALRGEP